MTREEADRAATLRVPVKICGATARTLYGEIRYSRIQGTSRKVDRWGQVYYTADLIKETSGRADSILVCDLKDVVLTDDAPESLRRLVYEDGESILSAG